MRGVVGNPPEHETILPFTRLMGGPMDYTPGIFQIKLDYYQPGKKEQVHTTLAKQLALYVTMYSPLQMAADLPENYERFMDAFQFIKDVAVDWDDTRILEAEPGDYLTIARKAKNKDEWYAGAITDEQARTANISLSYLTPKRWYVATLYTDAANAHWEKNPMAYQIQQFLVNDQTSIEDRSGEWRWRCDQPETCIRRRYEKIEALRKSTLNYAKIQFCDQVCMCILMSVHLLVAIFAFGRRRPNRTTAYVKCWIEFFHRRASPGAPKRR